MSRNIKERQESGALSDNQRVCVNLMVAGVQQVAIASQLEISPETISRWKREPEFLAELNKCRADVNEQVTETLRNMQLKALKVVGEMLDSTHPPTRQKGAELVLKVAPPIMPTVVGSQHPSAIAREQMIESL